MAIYLPEVGSLSCCHVLTVERQRRSICTASLEPSAASGFDSVSVSIDLFRPYPWPAKDQQAGSLRSVAKDIHPRSASGHETHSRQVVPSCNNFSWSWLYVQEKCCLLTIRLCRRYLIRKDANNQQMAALHVRSLFQGWPSCDDRHHMMEISGSLKATCYGNACRQGVMSYLHDTWRHIIFLRICFAEHLIKELLKWTRLRVWGQKAAA